MFESVYASDTSNLNLHLLEKFNPFYYVCLILALIVFHKVYTDRRKFRDVTSKVPTAFGWPLIGIGLETLPIKKLFYVMESYFLKFRCTTLCMWLGPEPSIVTVDPEIIKRILSSDEFLSKAHSLYKPIHNAIPNGIITSSPPKWKHNRKLINSCFSHQVLSRFVPIFNKGTKLLVRKFDELADSKEHDVTEMLKNTILQIAIETTMGIVTKEGVEMDEKLVKSFNFVLGRVSSEIILTKLNLGFLIHTRKYYNEIRFLRNYVEELIKCKSNTKQNVQDEQKTEEPEYAIKKNKDIFINQALSFQERGLFDVQDVISESYTMIVGSFETNSTTIYSVLVMLAMHPEVQERLYEEVRLMFPDKDFEVDAEQLKQLPYMDMVIDETLRLMPSIPLIGREAAKEIRLTEDLTLPKEMPITIPIFNLHRRKDIWGPNANAFNPDNFLPENVSQRHPYAYIPFSKGARSCIGMRYASISLRVILIGLIRNFKYSTNFKYEDLIFMDLISLRYDVEPKLKLERRP